MASVFAHAAAGLALGTAFHSRRLPARFWLLGAACAAAPDLDVIGFWLGVPWGHVLSHRGLTHSLPFAVAMGSLVAWLFFPGPGWADRRRWLAAYFALAMASHGVLDALTDGGTGVAFFAPFDNTRYFLPWRPIRVSPISIQRFLGPRGLEVLASELRWVLIPSALFALAVGLGRRALRFPARPRA